MDKKESRNKIIGILIVVLVFWIIDFVMHFTGVGESKYYYISKFVNALLFGIIWFFVFNSKKVWHKIVYSLVFGTWISFYYLVSSYSGIIQWLGIYARYTPPPFVVFGTFYSPFWWWVLHCGAFFLGLILSSSLLNRRK